MSSIIINIEEVKSALRTCAAAAGIVVAEGSIFTPGSTVWVHEKYQKLKQDWIADTILQMTGTAIYTVCSKSSVPAAAAESLKNAFQRSQTPLSSTHYAIFTESISVGGGERSASHFEISVTIEFSVRIK